MKQAQKYYFSQMNEAECRELIDIIDRLSRTAQRYTSGMENLEWEATMSGFEEREARLDREINKADTMPPGAPKTPPILNAGNTTWNIVAIIVVPF